MVTIKDVAERAGVSVPTVSRVINRHVVAEALKHKVEAAISELGYRPSRLARRLRSGDHKLFGAIFSDISNPFYIQVLQGAESVLYDEGISVLVSNAASDAKREDDLVKLMADEGVAGLLIAPTRESPELIEKAIDLGLAVVVVDRHMRDVAVDTVVSDNFNAARKAVEHLIALGNPSIGIISGPLHLSSARERYSGYLHALSVAGLQPNSDHTRFGDYRLRSGHDLALELIETADRPSALFVANNEMTIGALNAIHHRGLSIPDDVALIGFDDFPWSNSLNPPLTTIAQAPVQMGAEAAAMLIDRMANARLPARIKVLDTELVVRASCGANAGI